MKKVEIKNKFDSILAQSVASTYFLYQLNKTNYLLSDHFNNLDYGSKGLKSVIYNSSLGNPAILQMFLYALLVIPTEIDNKGSFKNDMVMIEAKIKNWVFNIKKGSKYKEKTYVRMIRNAISHSNTQYPIIDKKACITFRDQNPKNKNDWCEFTLTTGNVGSILDDLQKMILNYLNLKYFNKAKNN